MKKTLVTMSMYPAGISVCMIVKNEERFLADALCSVAGVADEICIVDTGSTDRTIEIARAHGAKVIEAVWEDDFAQARNAALRLATRRWILVLDADERLQPESRAAVTSVGRSPASGRGKWIACRNLTDDFKGSGAMTNALVRIFPNDVRIRYRNAIHEFVARDGSEAGLPSDKTTIEIVHHGYTTAVVNERRKAERNLRLSRSAAQRDPCDSFNHYNLGMACLLSGDREAAILALERMRELTRDTPRGFRVHGIVALAECYADARGDLVTALERVRECLALVPHYSNAHFVQGKLLARSGAFYDARTAFGRAIEAGVRDGEQFVVDNEIAIWKAHCEIGSTLMHERRYDEALKWFELASLARPTAQPLVINRAKCHEALGDLTAARALFGSAFARYEDEASAVEWINFLLRCDATSQALAAIERALPLVGDDCRPLLLGTAAVAHLRFGQLEQARVAVERAAACGDRTTSSATIRALAGHFGCSELAALLGPAADGGRAPRMHIAYVG